GRLGRPHAKGSGPTLDRPRVRRSTPARGPVRRDSAGPGRLGSSRFRGDPVLRDFPPRAVVRSGRIPSAADPNPPVHHRRGPLRLPRGHAFLGRLADAPGPPRTLLPARHGPRVPVALPRPNPPRGARHQGANRPRPPGPELPGRCPVPAHHVLVLFPRRDGNPSQEVARLRAAGIDRAWVTPQVPFMVPLLGGLLLAFFVGNVLLGVLPFGG